MLLGRHALRVGWHKCLTPFIWLLNRPPRQPLRLLIAPQDIRTADPTIASDIYAGYFALGGKIVDAHGLSPFDVDPPSPGWAEVLHGFGWLRHLRAADTSLARANAHALVGDWIQRGRRTSSRVAWQPRIVARRLLSWLSQSPIILDGADGLFYRQLMRSIGHQATFLQRRLGNGLTGDARLWAALALTEIGLCSDRTMPLKRASRLLLDEIGRQILADGGHVSRDPALLVDLLLDLLPLRQAYAARGAEVPLALLHAIDRMMPMLRMFRHPDGSLALFNGMGVTRPEALATILAYDDTRALPITNAPYSGYQRLDAEDSVLICETGCPPPLDFSRRAHAGALSFEFSAAGQRLVVNCGHPEAGQRAMLEASRSTAAHSTLVLDDTSSSRFVAPAAWAGSLEGCIAEGPHAVTVARQDTATELAIEISHDGYVGLGLLHRRRMAVAVDGLQLTGEDVLTPTTAEMPRLPFAIRFHLHPLARPMFALDGRGIAIALANGDRWLFEAGEAAMSIEESIFFAGPEGPRYTEQIVVEGRTPEQRVVRWSFARLGASSAEDAADA